MPRARAACTRALSATAPNIEELADGTFCLQSYPYPLDYANAETTAKIIEITNFLNDRWFANDPNRGSGTRHAVNMDGTKRLPSLLRSVMENTRPTKLMREVSHAAS